MQKQSSDELSEIKKLQKEAALESRKTEQSIQRLSDKIDRISEICGGIGNTFGKETEDKFYQILKARPVLGKILFDEVYKNIYIPPSLEIDILLLNGTAIGICEVKRRLRKTDIEKFFEKTLPKFIKFNNPYYNKPNRYVVFACETMESDVLEEIQKHDCFLISSDFKEDKFVIHQSVQH